MPLPGLQDLGDRGSLYSHLRQTLMADRLRAYGVEHRVEHASRR